MLLASFCFISVRIERVLRAAIHRLCRIVQVRARREIGARARVARQELRSVRQTVVFELLLHHALELKLLLIVLRSSDVVGLWLLRGLLHLGAGHQRGGMLLLAAEVNIYIGFFVVVSRATSIR